MMSSPMRPFPQHSSALTDDDYAENKKIFAEFSLDDGASVGILFVRGWLRGRFGAVSASDVDNILNVFSPTLGASGTLTLDQFHAAVAEVAQLAVRNQPSVADAPAPEAIGFALIEKHEPYFIDVHKWGTFREDDVQLNKIYPASGRTPLPPFVTNFIKRLDEDQPVVNLDTTPEYGCIHDAESRNLYLPIGGSEENQTRRVAGSAELHQVSLLANYEWQTFWPRRCQREDRMIDLFFAIFGFDQKKKDKLFIQYGYDYWPFRFITRLQLGELQSAREQHRTYHPKSDFLLMKSRFPRLVVEVASATSVSANEMAPDHVRMLLEGGSTVRLGNNVVAKSRRFVLCLFFIHASGKVTRYVLFQRDDGHEVYFTKNEFTLDSPVARARFVRQINNLAHLLDIEGWENDEATRNAVDSLDRNLGNGAKKFLLKSFMFTENRKRSAEDDAGRDTGGAGILGGEELRAHGYEVQDAVIVDEKGGIWEKLYKYPPNILEVCHISNRNKELIAKKVPADSKELEILKHLVGQPGREHIIPMLESFQTSSGSWLILPKMSWVRAYLSSNSDEFSGNAIQICWDLIKGLAYLHKHCIAHRDIKPDNLVIDEQFHLKIIDFGSAIQLKNEDEEVVELCGTHGWVAPEIEKQAPTYGPIKSDRWACGKVILEILNKTGKDDELLRTVATKLKAHDPKERPSLLEWNKWELELPYSKNQIRQHPAESEAPPKAKRARYETVQVPDLGDSTMSGP